MVIIIFAGGIFLGFSLGCATMALLDARGYRRQCEKAKETSGYALPLEGEQPFPARPPASGALGQLAVAP